MMHVNNFLNLIENCYPKNLQTNTTNKAQRTSKIALAVFAVLVTSLAGVLIWNYPLALIVIIPVSYKIQRVFGIKNQPNAVDSENPKNSSNSNESKKVESISNKHEYFGHFNTQTLRALVDLTKCPIDFEPMHHSALLYCGHSLNFSAAEKIFGELQENGQSNIPEDCSNKCPCCRELIVRYLPDTIVNKVIEIIIAIEKDVDYKNPIITKEQNQRVKELKDHLTCPFSQSLLTRAVSNRYSGVTGNEGSDPIIFTGVNSCPNILLRNIASLINRLVIAVVD